jgi:Tol biopolymer transport system component
MKKILIAIAIFGAAALTALFAADTAREQKLQQGISLMESKGDLAKAMPLFEEAARSSDRAVAARALLYLGEAQERQSAEKARATYERIVKEFGNQTETAAAAQKRLAALGGAPSSAALAKRLLCADCSGDFSPDGRLMVSTDLKSASITIRDMSSGKVTPLMKFTDAEEPVLPPLLSPDLRQMVYMTMNVPRSQLRVIPNAVGGKSRILLDNPEYQFCVPTAWFPDGKSVLVVLGKRDSTAQLARVTVADGGVTVLKSRTGQRALVGSPPSLSPDGRFVVYSAAADSNDRHIYVLAADGSSESEIVKTAGINESPVWTPDGKHILFTSDRSGKFDLWSVPVQNGKATGAESLVRADIGDISAIGMYGGSYYYTDRQRSAEYVNIADFTPSGAGQSRPAHPTESFVGMRLNWSPDGKSIAFKRHHPGEADEYDVVVHSLETGDERTYLTDLGTSDAGRPRWFHDGKAVLAVIGHGPRPFYRINLKTGEFKALPIVGLPPGVISPNDGTFYASRNDEKDWAKLPAHIPAVDLSSGREKEIFTMPDPGYAAGFGLTPDGRTLVVNRADQKTQTIHFYRLSIDGTGYREIYTIAQKDFRDAALTEDGRWILLAKRNDDKNWHLIRIPIEGGAPESTGVLLDAALDTRSLDLSPDGSRIAYTTTGPVSAEIWALDNILSAIK